jgi:transcription elongation GreA/GreB family factor
MSILRSAADGSDPRQGCRRERPITSPRAARGVCATNCTSFAQQTRAASTIELEQILATGHVVDPTNAPSNSVTFGATVTVKDEKGATETFTIVGVDELNFERDAVGWISPVGKALLNADMGDWIKLEDGRSAKIVKIEFKTGSD